LYDDEVAKKNCAACPALRTGARRLRATLLPFDLPSSVKGRAQRDESTAMQSTRAVKRLSPMRLRPANRA
jgi:hypothetical protein